MTRQQHKLLVYICDYLAQHTYAPSYAEMKDAMRLGSKSSIHRLINGLVAGGYIRTRPTCSRSVEVVRLPGDSVLLTREEWATVQAALHNWRQSLATLGPRSQTVGEVATRIAAILKAHP
jgi:repressor LexA